ncbi:MAG: DUF1841 family protein [Agriterribacter sp.]
MKENKIVREQILQVVENQLRDNKPPETKEAYNRLLQMGISEADAKLYIAQCVAVEIFDVMKYQRPFNEKRFIKNLKKLPEEPVE